MNWRILDRRGIIFILSLSGIVDMIILHVFDIVRLI